MVNLSGFDGKYSWIDMIDGHGKDGNPTAVYVKILNGRKYELLIKVRLQKQSASIDVLVNKVPFIRWRGKESSLSLYKEWSLPETQRFGLGANEPTTFHSVNLKMVSGKEEWVKWTGVGRTSLRSSGMAPLHGAVNSTHSPLVGVRCHQENFQPPPPSALNPAGSE